jgi:ribose transport system permease protein
LSRFVAHYGMLGVLLLLGAFFSVITVREQQPEGARAGRSLASRVARAAPAGCRIILVERVGAPDRAFAMTFAGELSRCGRSLTARIPGDPADVRLALEHEAPPLVVATPASSAPAVRSIIASIPALAGVVVVEPASYRWPTLLLPSNLRNVANQIAVIAILAVGMTLVIISGGIDLSVGSLIALSAVCAAGLVGMMGGEAAGTGALLVAALAATLLCGIVGLFSGFMVTRFRVPPDRLVTASVARRCRRCSAASTRCSQVQPPRASSWVCSAVFAGSAWKARRSACKAWGGRASICS